MEEARIILVDDDTDLSGVLRDFLLSKGYAVDTFETVREGWQNLISDSYDLAILDWDLPDGTGVELCRRYRDNGGRAPVLMMTGRKELDDKEFGLEAGADDYVTKPFALRELLARIKSLLRRAITYAPVTNTASYTEPEPGAVISGKYKLEDTIGKGGMALVWLASDLQMERQVVVKLMHTKLLDDGETAQRFMHECKVLAKLKHPNIVTVYDTGILNGRIPYIVMEYVRGKTLRNWLEDFGPLDINTTIGIMSQICHGLQEAHEAGIVHRDLKPENILIQDTTGRLDAVKIADFGIARRLDSKERLTREGIVVGTLEYISPDQLQDEGVDARADIYAMGIMIFELLTGELPLTANTVESMIAKHLVGIPKLPSEKCAFIAPGSGFDQLVEKCLQKRAQDRYQSAYELRLALEKLLNS